MSRCVLDNWCARWGLNNLGRLEIDFRIHGGNCLLFKKIQALAKLQKKQKIGKKHMFLFVLKIIRQSQ